MKKAVILALVLTMGLTGNAIAQTKIFLLTSPSQSWGTLTTVGGSLDVVGKFNKNSLAAGQPLAWNTSSTIEYTFYMTGMTLDLWVDGAVGTYDSSYYGAGGTISIYEGTPVNASLGATAPPNATSPSTFTDVAPAILTGIVNDLKVMRRENSPGPQYIGEARGSVTFTGGTRLTDICGTSEPSWIFNTVVSAGTSSGISGTGYNLRWSGELLKRVCPPIATEEKTWGSIKTLYR